MKRAFLNIAICALLGTMFVGCKAFHLMSWLLCAHSRRGLANLAIRCSPF